MGEGAASSTMGGGDQGASSLVLGPRGYGDGEEGYCSAELHLA